MDWTLVISGMNRSIIDPWAGHSLLLQSLLNSGAVGSGGVGQDVGDDVVHAGLLSSLLVN